MDSSTKTGLRLDIQNVSLHSHIHNIPNEILAIIFQGAMDQPGFMDEEDRRTLTIIRCVCTRWDGVAISTPILWKSLQIDYDADITASQSLALRLNAWLSRAGVGAPLRLSLGRRVHPYSEPASQAFVNVITSFWNWSQLHLRIGTVCLVGLLDALAEKDFKPWRSLKVLALDLSTRQNLELDLGDRELPALEHLHLSFTCLEKIWDIQPGLVPSVRLKHSSVTTLCLSNTAVVSHRWLPTLLDTGNFPSLCTLILQDLRFIGGAADNLPSSVPNTINIERLIIRGSSSILALNYFTFPATKFLQLINADQETALMQGVLYACLARSQIHLETLCLTQANLLPSTECDIISFLKSCRTVQVESFSPLNWDTHRLPSLFKRQLIGTVISSNLAPGRGGLRAWADLIQHLQARSRIPGAPCITIVVPETEMPHKKYPIDAPGLQKDCNALEEGGWVKFLSSVDDLHPDDATVLEAYETSGPFAGTFSSFIDLVAVSDLKFASVAI
jgi:F-box-like